MSKDTSEMPHKAVLLVATHDRLYIGKTGRFTLTHHFATEDQPESATFAPWGQMMTVAQVPHSMSAKAIEKALESIHKRLPPAPNPETTPPRYINPFDMPEEG